MTPYYEKDGIVIYHGDCRDVLPNLGRFNLCLIDPPYGIGEARGKNKSRTNLAIARDYGVNDWDDACQPEGVKRSVSLCDNAIVWGGNYYLLPPSSCWLVWDKENTGDFADCELAWTNLKKAVRIFRWQWNGMLRKNKEPRFHPTQKPLALMKWCIQQAGDVKTVLDSFMGSGTVLRAAMDLGISAVGIEKEESYCEIAARRLDQKVFNFTD